VSSCCWFLSIVFISIRIHKLHKLSKELALKYTPDVEKQRSIHTICAKISIILGFPMVFSTLCLLALFLSKSTLVFVAVRDSYESVAIFEFLNLLIQYLGGINSFRMLLKDNNTHCYDCIPDFIRIGMLQFVILRPFLGFLSIIFDEYGIYHEGTWTVSSGFLWKNLVNVISTTWALNCLIFLYRKTRVQLEERQPFWKFLCIKLIIFFSFFQALVLGIIVQGQVFPQFDQEGAAGIQNFLLIVEMFFLVPLYYKAYPILSEEFERVSGTEILLGGEN